MFPFRNLFALSLTLAVTLFLATQSKASSATASGRALQFTSAGHVLGFEPDAVYVAGASHALRIQFVDPCVTAPASNRTGDDAKGSAPLVPVNYPNLWDGISLTYDAPADGVVRSTYRLAPHADANAIRLRYNAPIEVQQDGSLRINFSTGTMNESAPRAWQERDGKQVPVPIAFVLREKAEVAFAVGEYDRNEPLFIDPTLIWNTFLGSGTDDQAFGVAVDATGNVFVAGQSDASWGSPLVGHHGGYDIFVARLDSNGNLIWNTFLGGSGNEIPSGLALDATGNIYLAGLAYESWGTPIRAFSGIKDAFAAKMDSNGNLIWNTFLGGNADDAGNAVAVDVTGNVYVAGFSSATWGSPIRAHSGGYDGFVAKLDSNGAMSWNSFLGSAGTDQAESVAADILGNVYVSGYSTATWGSPIRPFYGFDDAAFAAKLNSTGGLVWNTFLGGGAASGGGVKVDASGNVYVAGFCSGGSWGSPVRPFSGAQDAYAAKLDANGGLIWNTFLGASGQSTVGGALALDASGNLYLGGYTTGSWGSPSHPYTGGYDTFAAQLDPNGILTWNTFLEADEGNAIALDPTGNVVLTGAADQTFGSPIRDYNSGGAWDAFVAKVPVSGPDPDPTPTPTPSPTPSPTPTPTPTPTATPFPSPTPTPTPVPSPTPTPTPLPTPTPTPTPVPSVTGNFVIGDGNAAVGNHVTFWSAQWADLNSLSGGSTAGSFKGFTNSMSPNPAACGGAWTSTPGNSAGPPSSVPSFITVIVSSSITKSGATISGNIPKMAIVSTDPGYGPNPGQSGTGTVVAVICASP